MPQHELPKVRGLLLVTYAAIVGVTVARAETNPESPPAVTPYRPSVSTPAQLSSPGWLEGEFGLLHARNGGAERDSVPFALKYAFTPDWGIRLGGEAWVRDTQSSDGPGYAIGDTALIIKRRFAMGARGTWGALRNAAVGVEGGVIEPTGRDGVGKTAYAINSIFSADLGMWHSDSNVFVTRLTSDDPSLGHWQWGWASSLSRAMSERISVGGELSGTRQSGAADTAQWLVAGSYLLSSGSVVDVGVARSLGHSGITTQVFCGITIMLAHLRP